ncbi:MAG: hypothetical protein ACRDZO_09070 [Egibacteraceae bacterium]
MCRERLEWAGAWIAWARAALECEFSQLVGETVCRAVVPLDGSAAGWVGAAIAARSGQRLADQRLSEVLAVLVEVERQIAWALAEISGEAA